MTNMNDNLFKLAVYVPDDELLGCLQKELIYHSIKILPIPETKFISSYVRRFGPNGLLVSYKGRGEDHSQVLAELQTLSGLKDLWIIVLVSNEAELTEIQSQIKSNQLLIQDIHSPKILIQNLITLKYFESKLHHQFLEKEYQKYRNECLRIIYQEKNLQSVFEKLIFQLPKTIDMDYWALFALDKNMTRIEFFAQFIPPTQKKSIILTPQLEKIIQSWISAELPFLVTPSEKPDLFKDLHKVGWKVKNLYFIPIKAKGVIIGGVALGSTGSHHLTSREIHFLQELNQPLAHRILEENLTLLEREEVSLFSDTLIANHFDEEAIFQNTCKTLNTLVNSDSTIFWQYNKGFGFLFPKYFHVADPQEWKEFPEKEMIFLEKEKYLNQLIYLGKNKSIKNILKEKRLDESTRRLFEHLNYQNILLLPLQIDKEIIGAIILNKRKGDLHFSAWEIEKAEAVIRRARIVLESARAVREANLKLKQLSRIFELGSELTLGLNLPEILDRISQSIRKTLGWNDVAILLEDELGVKYETISRVGFDQGINWPIKFEESIFLPEFERFISSCQKIANSYFYSPQSFTLTSSRSLLTGETIEWHDEDLLFVPLKTRDKVLGYLIVHDPVDRLRPTAEKISPLEYYANQAAVAVENFILYEKLRASQERYRALSETMSLGLVTCDLQGKIIYVNPAFQELLGYHQSQLISQDIISFFSPKEADKLRKMVAELLSVDTGANKRIENEEFIIINKDHESIPVSVFGFPLFELQEKTGFFLILNDLREMKQLEQIKADFNSMIVHDLRSPMNVIQGFIELIRNRVVGEINHEQEELLDIAKENVKKVLALIDNFLVASKLDVGKFTLEPKLDELNALIEQQVENHKVLVKNKNIHLEMDLDRNLPLLLFDSLRIEQVLNNLLSNAMKFTPENGRIRVRSRLIKHAVNGEEKFFASVSVEDNGPGIPENKLSRIFDKYEQVENNSQFTVSGTGLGLSICKEIIELHGGKIWVDSKPNQGSTFTFLLPIESTLEKIIK
ncbi:MAG: PAS domain S-box protein [Calditrichaeota bacterium]|nr:MAG: PAS domain S-box protein [Calditrichota bacterium]